MVEVISAAQG